MHEAEKPKPRRRRWARRILWVVAGLAGLAALSVVFLPDLLPGAALRREVQAVLSQRLGRPVTIRTVSYGWQTGLEIYGLEIGPPAPQEGAAAGDPSPLARAERVAVRFNPIEVAQAVTAGESPPLESIRIDGLEVWLALDKDGHLNVEGLGSGQRLKAHAIQVAGGTVHFDNRKVGRAITLTNLSASVGELESTGRGYVNLTAELPATRRGEKPGSVLITANLSSLDLAAIDQLTGSVKIEWTGVAWPEAAAVATADPRITRACAETNGRLAATLGVPWSLEGSVRATGLVLGQSPDGGDITLPEAVLGIQARQLAAGKPPALVSAKFSAPGIVLEGSGMLRLPETLAEKPAPAAGGRAKAAPPAKVSAPAAASTTAKASASGKARADESAGKPAGRLEEFQPASIELGVAGSLVWAPLCQNIGPLKKFAARFDQLGGGADVTFHLTSIPEGYRVSASVDFLHTLAIWPGVLKKETGQVLRLEATAKTPRDFSWADVKRLVLLTDFGPTDKEGRPQPLVTVEGYVSRRPTETWLEATAEVWQVEGLLAMAPALAAPLAGIDAEGPLEARLSVKPVKDIEGPPTRPGAPPAAWIAAAHVDLTQTQLWGPAGTIKPARTRAAIDGSAVVVPDGRRLNVTSFKAALAGSSVEWDGSAQLEWPKGQPAGRFEGTLTVSGVESAGAVLAPGRFPAAAPLVAGGVKCDVLGDLAEGRIRAQVRGNLAPLAVHAGNYFIKPAGQPAAFTLTGFVQPSTLELEKLVSGNSDHRFLAEADVELVGVKVHALGRGTVLLARSEAAPAAAPAGDVLPGRLVPALAPDTTLEVRAMAADIPRAMELSPAAKRALDTRKVEGGGDISLVFTRRPRAWQVAGTVDLTAAAIEVGQILSKPRDMPLRFDVAAAVLPPEGQTGEVFISKAEVRLADSTVSASGRLRLAEPGPLDSYQTCTQVLALLQEADMEVRADVRHSPELRGALGCLAPLYARADLDGRTELTASFAGTPLRGRMQLTLDATACRILHGTSILKPAGTPATVRFDARYGEVPGELVVDNLAMKLADSSVTADVRVMFDNPRLTTLSAPSAWSVGVEGKAPDAAALAALFPARLEDLKPTGGVTFRVQASGDAAGAEIQSCDFRFDKAGIVWLGRKMLLAGPVTYDGQRLAADGLNIQAGRSDVTLVAYIMQPDRAPTGSIVIKGERLDLDELQGLIEETSKQVTKWAADLEASTAAPAPAAAPPKTAAAAAGAPTPETPVRVVAGKARAAAPKPVSEQLALWGQRLLARAQLSCELGIRRTTLTVQKFNATYELSDFSGEGRLAGSRLVVPRFQCAMNKGTISGEVALDFRSEVPILELAYDARDLQMGDNLKPFIDTTFPGMQCFGSLSTNARITRRLEPGARRLGRGEVTLVDGMLVGPGAPEYIANLLPGLKLTEYRFRRMTNEFQDQPNGDVENRMLFEGKSYDIYIFGMTHADGRTDYTLGVDLLVSLGSRVLSRDLGQGKLPLMRYRGRIKGTKFAEEEVSFVPPHEFAYEVFVRRNLLLQLIAKLGEKPPKIQRPPGAPPEKVRPPAEPPA